MTIRDDSYIRSQALKAALRLTKLRLGEKPGVAKMRQLCDPDEVKATAKVFEEFIRGW